MLVWGGRVSYSEDSVVGDGGRYDPATDTWRPMSAEGAPAARAACDAVWTGTELIIWGNVLGPVPDAQGLGPGYSDGARYDPLTDHWRPLPQIDLVGHLLLTRAVWIGDGLLVWGGRSDGPRVGAIYSPQTDRWTALRPSPAFEQPGTARFSDGRPAVWTGSEVIGWGGVGGKPFPVTGGFRYAPATQAWSALPTTGAPGERLHHTVVWTGQGVLVWGGGWIGRGTQTVDGGGWFDPEGDRWLPISDVDAPTPRVLHTAVWTGSEMIVWGGHNQWSAGSNGGVYTPAAG